MTVMAYPPEPPHQPRRVVTKSGISGMGIGVHLILTICTGGCWGVVWFLHWLFTRNKQVTTY
jgi:hypothetical protein